MLSIQKTYVCSAPENTSVYRCKNDGTPTFKKIGIIPYQSPMIKTPESTFAKRRNDIDIGFAISPITFIGNNNGIGSKSDVKCFNFLFLIPWKFTIKNVKSPSKNVTP